MKARRPQVSPIRVRVAVLALCAGLSAAGCAAGQIAETAQETPVIDGVAGQTGHIAVRGASVKQPDGGFYAKGSTAALQFVVSNSGSQADSLQSVSSAGASGAMITGGPALGSSASAGTSASPAPSGSIVVPAGRSVSVGFAAVGAQVVLQNLTNDLFPATSLPITFTFEHAGAITLKVAVHLKDSNVPSPSYVPSESLAPSGE